VGGSVAALHVLGSGAGAGLVGVEGDAHVEALGGQQAGGGSSDA
jgi:hypothetical protein